MNVIRNAVVLMPTREEHDKFTAFVEAYSDIKWCTGMPLSKQSQARPQEAYLIDNGKVSHADISYFTGYRTEYLFVPDDVYLISVDEYIARCIGWVDIESDSEIDFSPLLKNLDLIGV